MQITLEVAASLWHRVAKELQSEAKTRIYRKTERKDSNGQNKDEDTNKDIYR